MSKESCVLLFARLSSAVRILLVVYALSLGPAWTITGWGKYLGGWNGTFRSIPSRISLFYQPLRRTVATFPDPIRNVFRAYLGLWISEHTANRYFMTEEERKRPDVRTFKLE